MSTPTTCFIVNPHSAGGRTKRNWEKLEPTVRGALTDVQVRYTEGVGGATKLCREALEEGVELVVSVGGDGTNNEIINGFFQPDGSLIRNESQFAFFPMGSGGDLRRTLPHAKDIHQLIAQIQSGTSRQIDVGKVTFQGADGQEAKRYFLNISSIGISGVVNQRVNRSKKRLGGSAAFFIESARALFGYKNPMFQLSLDDNEPIDRRCHLLIVANGRYFGGGMMAAPQAEMDDGYLDLVILGDYSKRTLLLSGSKIYSGKHIDMPDTTVQRIRKIHVEADRDIWLDIDGEVPGHTPATLEVIPQVLPIRLP